MKITNRGSADTLAAVVAAVVAAAAAVVADVVAAAVPVKPPTDSTSVGMLSSKSSEVIFALLVMDDASPMGRSKSPNIHL